jgi:hypothetical protein
MLCPENTRTKGKARSEITSEEVWLTKSLEASKESAAPVDAQKTQCLCAD